MKRRLLIIGIFLLLGAVVNVAVAWGIDSWNKQRCGPAHVLQQRRQGGIPSYHRSHLYAVGFPANAMGYTWSYNSLLQQHRLRPLWPGFAVNTLFYATLLWLLIPGPFVLRRFLRVRRGLCPKCAYPRGESQVCTECGCGLLTGRPARA